MSLFTKLSRRDHRRNAVASYGQLATPGHLGRPVPLTSIAALRRARGPSFSNRHRKETFRWLGGGDAFSDSRRFPAPSHSASRLPAPCLGRTSCLFSTHARTSWRQTEVCLQPLICFGQTRASRPPPLQHRVPTRTRGERSRSLEFSASGRQPYPDYSGAFSVAGRPALGTGARPGLTTGPFQPHGILDVRMSLSTFSFIVDVARQRF